MTEEEGIKDLDDRMRSQTEGTITPEQRALAKKRHEEMDKMLIEELRKQGREDLIARM
ncbi:MAG: hypothetical protein RR626_05785 [Anaerovoracaceae bacterium]